MPASNSANGALTRRRGPWLVAILVIAIAAGAYYYFYHFKAAETPAAPAAGAKGGKGKGGRGGDRPVPVVAVPATTGDVQVYLSGLGTVTPVSTVVVRSRIDGQLMRVLFNEGQVVRAGELLAEIDPRPYQVQLATAEGQMARDQALLRNAQIDAERYRVLLKQDSIAKQQVDTQEALVRQYEGTVKINQAAIDTARLNLAYTRITAPIGGRLGLRQVDPGNMVRSGDANGIVVITQLQPIGVVFPIPEDSLPPVMTKIRAGAKLPVDAYDRADKVKLATGMLVTADNQIDPATGTVKLKAVFANTDNALFPSQFANARMLLETRTGSTLVPSSAIQRGTPGTFVYVVNPGNTASVRRVVLGPVQGTFTSIESGVTPGETVVVDGADKLREGARVEVSGAPRDFSKGGPRKGGEGRKGGAEGAAPGGAAEGKGGPGAGASKGASAGEATKPNPAVGREPGAKAGAPSEQPGGGAQQGGGGWGSMTPEERAKRWAEINARIDRGDFGEEIKKLPEDARKARMRELRQKREAAGGGG